MKKNAAYIGCTLLRIAKVNGTILFILDISLRILYISWLLFYISWKVLQILACNIGQYSNMKYQYRDQWYFYINIGVV